jgi:phospholipid/cholesterol/gamma-HCH transport system substrate-binding protein
MAARRSWAEVGTGFAVLVVAGVFLGYAILHGGRAGVPEGLTLTANFDRIDGLNQGSDVRIAGVRVGTVTSLRIDPQSFDAVVTMRVDPDLRLPTDTSAEITSEGLLGGRFVSLVPGGAEQVLRNGGRITETQGSVSLESLLGRFIFSVTQVNQGQQPGSGSGGAAPAPR